MTMPLWWRSSSLMRNTISRITTPMTSMTLMWIIAIESWICPTIAVFAITHSRNEWWHHIVAWCTTMTFLTRRARSGISNFIGVRNPSDTAIRSVENINLSRGFTFCFTSMRVRTVRRTLSINKKGARFNGDVSTYTPLLSFLCFCPFSLLCSRTFLPSCLSWAQPLSLLFACNNIGCSWFYTVDAVRRMVLHTYIYVYV